MLVLVVYESFTGNTRQVAEAVAEGIRSTRPGTEVQVTPAYAAPRDLDPDLLVVGAPVHAWGPPRPSTRRMWRDARRKAEQRGALPAAAVEEGAGGPGLLELLAALPRGAAARRAAVFDTRLPNKLAGTAGRRIGRELRRHGFDVVGRPRHFIVTGAEGPLRHGELDRAKTWGATLAETLAATTARA